MNTRSNRLPGLPIIQIALAFLLTALLMAPSCSCSLNSKSQGNSVKVVSVDDPIPEYTRTDKFPEIDGVLNFVEVDKQPEPFDEVRPIYPELPKILGKTSTVILTAVVHEDGRTSDIAILSSTGGEFRDEFEREAVRAFAKSKFKPALLKGKPVPCWIKMTYRFRLEEGN
ncbi:MAG: energy transducer TonB [Candidatus Coatesbacteria bacterium]|nr:energy transducer TonB [Candidatus Coatesbacteria bacterium]